MNPISRRRLIRKSHTVGNLARLRISGELSRGAPRDDNLRSPRSVLNPLQSTGAPHRTGDRITNYTCVALKNHGICTWYSWSYIYYEYICTGCIFHVHMCVCVCVYRRIIITDTPYVITSEEIKSILCALCVARESDVFKWCRVHPLVSKRTSRD